MSLKIAWQSLNANLIKPIMNTTIQSNIVSFGILNFPFSNRALTTSQITEQFHKYFKLKGNYKYTDTFASQLKLKFNLFNN